MAKAKSKPPAQRPQARKATSYAIVLFLVAAAAIAIFQYSCFKYELTQDDAYISFRYAANFLHGDGLVFNAGERVEGYTNFLWVMLMALAKQLLGIDFIVTTRLLGVAAGSLLFLLFLWLMRDEFKENPVLLYAATAAMMLTNLSLAYWSIASLETAAFAFMALAALVCEYRKPQLTPALLVLASLLRPEGATVFGVCFLNRWLAGRALPLRFALTYIVPLLPFAAFKLGYYGSLFPNPYYAKSGVGLEYIATGLQYFWAFTKDLGGYGVLFLVPLLAVKRLWGRFSLLYIYVLLFCFYIIWVGGDVLFVYRFFFPVAPVLYFLFAVALLDFAERFIKNAPVAKAAFVAVVAAFSIASYSLSINHVKTYWFYEQNIVRKMHFLGTMLKKHMGNDFSVAVSTIGMISYQLLGHRVIDLLGLTDSYIARHPEQIPGMTPTWKERRFNSSYLLSQQPDFIIFSTGYKPSAPAERALMMHSEFRHKFSPMGFVREGSYKVFWMRHGEIDMAADSVHHDYQFVERMVDGFYHTNRTGPQTALPMFKEAEQRLGEVYPLLDYAIGDCFYRSNQKDSARARFDRAIAMDDYAWEARIHAQHLALERGDTASVYAYGNYIMKRFPWLKDDSYRSPFPPLQALPPDRD